MWDWIQINYSQESSFILTGTTWWSILHTYYIMCVFIFAYIIFLFLWFICSHFLICFFLFLCCTLKYKNKMLVNRVIKCLIDPLFTVYKIHLNYIFMHLILFQIIWMKFLPTKNFTNTTEFFLAVVLSLACWGRPLPSWVSEGPHLSLTHTHTHTHTNRHTHTHTHSHKQTHKHIHTQRPFLEMF